MKKLVLASFFALAFAGQADAATEVQFWHAMGGQLGEIVDKFAADFNASQSDYELKAVYKGNYTETMTSAIAAFRAKEQPHIVQVFEVGTATMMAAGDKGAVYPVHQLMTDAGEPRPVGVSAGGDFLLHHGGQQAFVAAVQFFDPCALVQQDEA